MSNHAFAALSGRLEGLGIYDITQGSEIFSRLSALAEGLELYYEILDDIFKEMFVCTAENEGLEEYEKMLPVINTDSSTQGRRNSIISALSVNEKNGAERILGHIGDIYNITGELTGSGRTLTFTTDAQLTSQQAQLIEDHISSLMPVGTSFELVLNT